MDVARFVIANIPFQNITAAPDFAHDSKLFLRRNHPTLAGVIENAAGVHDGAHVAERFEFIFSAAIHG
jgi:hypothetical protein